MVTRLQPSTWNKLFPDDPIQAQQLAAWAEQLFLNRGSPGESTQRVYRATATENRPAIAESTDAQKANDDYIPSGWSGVPIDVSETSTYVWVSERKGTSEDWG